MSDVRRALRLAGLRLSGRAIVAAGHLPTSRRSSAARGAGGAPRVLLIRPDHLGDTLLASPAARVLRGALPGARVDWLVGPWSAELLARCDAGAEILTAEFPGFTRRPKRSPVEPYLLLVQEAARLRERAYDAALILRPDHWWGALLAAAAGIPRRFGFAVPECRPFLNESLPVPDTHAVRANQRLARLAAGRLGGGVADGPPLDPTFAVRPDEAAWARDWLAGHVGGRRSALDDAGAAGRTRHRPLVVLHPGTGAPVKTWLPARWSRVIDALRARAGADVILTGGPAERPLIETIAAGLEPPPPTLVGETSLGQLAALFASCDLVVGGDSGPLHLAATVETPTLRLYGPTDLGEFGPWPPTDRHHWLAAQLPCQPCRSFDPPCGAVETPACLRVVSVDSVVAGALHLLDAARTGPTPETHVPLATIDLGE